MVCGYLGQPGQAGLRAGWLPALRAARPDLRVHIDPVMGDRNDGLYVDEGLVAQYRELLVPLADGMTPNHFELELLVGRTLSCLDDVVAAARELIALGPDWIVVTSAAPMEAAAGALQLAVVTGTTPPSSRIRKSPFPRRCTARATFSWPASRPGC